jgi:hypothetical protein
MEEMWESIKDYPDYQVSNSGKVYSLKNNMELKGQVERSGYRLVKLFINGKAKSWMIHRLVANAFMDNWNNKSQVNHKDGNKQNNYFLNLEWVTASENQLHAIKEGLVRHCEGETHFNCKLSSNDDAEIAELYKTQSQVQIAKMYEISQSSVGRALNRYYKKGIK